MKKLIALILLLNIPLLLKGEDPYWIHVQKSNPTTRSLPDRIVDCFSRSEYEEGHTYWDCGNCKRYEHQKGVGNMRTCQPDENQM